MTTLRQKAASWIEANPYLMSLFVAFAEDRRARGLRFGAKQLAERVRWETAGSAEAPKINNNFIAYIARELCARDPRLCSLLECRVTPAAERAYVAPVFNQQVDPLEVLS